MDMLTTLLQFLFALFGLDLGGSTFSHRSSVDGVDTLHSVATVESGIAHFECLASASGRCVYTVFPETCAGAPALAGTKVGRCRTAAPTRFSLPAGKARDVAGLRVKSLCVRADDAMLSPACERPEALAVR
jgi:hypothetical protein